MSLPPLPDFWTLVSILIGILWLIWYKVYKNYSIKWNNNTIIWDDNNIKDSFNRK
jgi:hypothetical protein